jgi:2-methylcitrate dehydratase PrpD
MSRVRSADRAVKVLTPPFFGPPRGIVIGRGDRPDALNAAFLNAVSANALEYDDTHAYDGSRPGDPLHPVAVTAPSSRPRNQLRPAVNLDTKRPKISRSLRRIYPDRIFIAGEMGSAS